MSNGRNFICWLDGEQFAVLCYSHTGALVKVSYYYRFYINVRIICKLRCKSTKKK